jgi:hypothetical protein
MELANASLAPGDRYCVHILLKMYTTHTRVLSGTMAFQGEHWH